MECSIFYNKNEHEHVQKKTFTKWINSVLAKKDRNYQIKNIYVDLCDGIKLLEIMEILTHTKLIIERKKEMQRVHCFANVASVLRFLSSKRKVKLININASDIVDGRPNIVLGLVWQIIQNFQIRNDEKFKSIALKDVDPARRHSLERGTPKEALLAWTERILTDKYGLEIHDFHLSWKDGLAFNALIHSINPDLVDLKAVRGRSPRENLEIAFQTAEKYLNIPSLLEAEDVDVQYPDEKSIMTYVAQFLQNYSDEDLMKKRNSTTHNCDEQNFSNTLTLTNPTTNDGQAKSSYTKLELNKSSKKTIFEANVTMNLKSTNKKPTTDHQIRQIQHSHLTEDEEKEALNEECNRLLGHIKRLLEEIDNCLKGNSMKSANSITEELKIFIPIMEKITELKSLQQKIEDINSANPNVTKSTTNLLKSIDKDFQDRQTDMRKWQWKIEKLIPGNDQLSMLFDCMQHCEEGEIFLNYITLKLILDIEFGFVEKVKAAIISFPQLKDLSKFTDSSYGLPEIYLQNCKERIIAIENSLPRLSTYFEFILMFKALNNEIWTQEERVKHCMSDFGGFEVLGAKFETLKSFVQSNQIERFRTELTNLSATASLLINTYLTKKISSQMVINQCTQKINDDITKLLRDSEETLKLHKTLLQKWKSLNEKRDRLKDWITEASNIVNKSQVDREQFMSSENNYDKIYQDYFKEKSDFPSLDVTASLFLDQECSSLTTEYNSILSQFDNLRQQEKIDILKKEFYDRLQRIEKWLDKSETIVEKKIACHKSDVEECIEILEAAAKNFDTVKNDIQRSAKVGEAMFKSNMKEEEVEEVLGTLNVNKERFINVRDKINSKIKKMKKLLSVATLFDRNIEEITAWTNSVNQLFAQFENAEDPGDSHFFMAWMEDYESLMNDRKLKEIQERKSENFKILERIKEKIEDEVNTKECELVLNHLSNSVTKLIFDCKRKKDVNKFKHGYERFKKILYTIDDEIVDEEGQMNALDDFSEILLHHEKFFGSDDKRAQCIDMLAELSELKWKLETSQTDDDNYEYGKLIEELENSQQNTFAKVSEVKESLITLPQKISDMKERMKQISEWIDSVKSLSVKLDMSRVEAKETPTAEMYKATMNEFQQLSNLSATNVNETRELKQFLAGLASSRLAIIMEQDMIRIRELCDQCQEMQPEIAKVLSTAPVIAKSIEFKEEVAKRNEKLLEMKNKLENIPDEDECEEIDDIYEQEQRIIASLDQETPEIMQEIAECRELQAKSESAKILSSNPIDLEGTWDNFNEVIRKRLIKLRTTKEALQRVEDVTKKIESDFDQIEGDLENIDYNICDMDSIEAVAVNLKQFFRQLDNQFPDTVEDLEKAIEKGKTIFSKQKQADFLRKKDKILDRIEDLKSNISAKMDDIKKMKQIRERFENRKNEFKRFVSEIREDIREIKDKSKIKVDDKMLDELVKLMDEIEVRLSSSERYYCDMIEELSEEMTELAKLLKGTIAEECEQCEILMREVQEIEECLQKYQKSLDKVHQIEMGIKEEIEEVKDRILKVEPLQMNYSQWKTYKPENLLEPIYAMLRRCSEKVNKDLKTAMNSLEPKSDDVNYILERILEEVDEEQRHLGEIKEILEEGVAFIKFYKDGFGNLQKQTKAVSESLSKVNKNKHKSLKDKISAIDKIVDNIGDDLNESQRLIEKIETKNHVFNDEIRDKLISELRGLCGELGDQLRSCEELKSAANKDISAIEALNDNFDNMDNRFEVLETRLTNRRLIFGDNTENKVSITECLSSLEDLKNNWKKENDSLDSLLKRVTDDTLCGVQDKSKYCKAKVAVIEKEATEKLTFVEWLSKFDVEFHKVLRDVDDGRDEIEKLDADRIEDFSKSLKATKIKMDNLRNMLKNRKKNFPVFHSGNFQELNLPEMVDQIEEKLTDLTESFEKEKKNVLSLKEDWKDALRKKKALNDNLTQLEKNTKELQIKDCAPGVLGSVEKELRRIEDQVKKFEPEISSLLEFLEVLKQKRPSLSPSSDLDLNQEQKIFNDIIVSVDRKLEAVRNITNASDELSRAFKDIEEEMCSLKSKIKIQNKFSKTKDMLQFFKELNRLCEDQYEKFAEEITHVDNCIEEIDRERKYFPNLSCKSYVNVKEKIKLEIDNLQTLSKKLLTDISVELEKLKNVSDKIRSLESESNEFMETLNSLTNGNPSNLEIQISTKEDYLKALRGKQAQLLEKLKEKHSFLNVEPLETKIKELTRPFDKAEELLTILREKIRNILKEKDRLSGKLSEFSNRFSKCKDELRIRGTLDKSELERVTRAKAILEELQEQMHGYEEQCEALFDSVADNETARLRDDFANLRQQILDSGEELFQTKEKITRKIKDDYDNAKREHEQWMEYVEAKIRDADYHDGGYCNIDSQLESLNDLIKALGEGRMRTANVVEKSNMFHELPQPIFHATDEFDKRTARELEERFNAMVESVLEQKRILEARSMEAKEQKDLITEVTARMTSNEKRLSSSVRDNFGDVSVKRKRIADIDNIISDTESSLGRLMDIESRIQDSLLKESVLSQILSHRQFLKMAQNERQEMVKNLKLHEEILGDLRDLNFATKERISRLRNSGNSFPVIDEKYLKMLEQEIQELSKFLRESSSIKLNCEENGHELIKDSSNPGDLTKILSSIHTDIGILTKNFEKLKNELKTAQDLFNEWIETFTNLKDSMERIEKSLNNDMVPAAGIEGKEELLEKCLANKHNLDDLRASIRNLEKLSQDLNNSVFLTQLVQIKNQHKDLQNRSSENYSQIQKVLQNHKEYSTKMTDLKRRIKAIKVDDADKIALDSTKYIMTTVKRNRDQAEELESELKRMESSKNGVCYESSQCGRDLVNEEFLELVNEIKTKRHSLELTIERVTNDCNKLESCGKRLSTLGNWIKATRKSLKIDQWDADIESVLSTLNNRKILNAEIVAKIEEIQEVRNLLGHISIDPTETLLTIDETETAIDDIDHSVKDLIKEGEEVRKCLQASRDVEETIKRKHDGLKSELHSTRIMSMPNNLVNEITRTDVMLLAMPDLKALYGDWRAVIESLPRGNTLENIHRTLSGSLEKAIKEGHGIEDELKKRREDIASKKDIFENFNGQSVSFGEFLEDMLTKYHSLDKSIALEERLKIEEELCERLNQKKQLLDQVLLSAEQSGFETCKETSKRQLSQFSRLFDELNQDIEITQKDISVLHSYQRAISDLESDLDNVVSLLSDLKTVNFSQVEDVSTARIQAIDVKKQTSTIQSNINSLEQEFGGKIKLFTLKQRPMVSVSELKHRSSDVIQESSAYIQKCDSELTSLTEYNEANKQLQDAIRTIRSALVSVEKSGDLLPEHFDKIKCLKSEIITNETLVDNLNTIINQSSILSRSPKVNADATKSQKDLRELKDKYDTLSRVAHKDTLTRDKYAAIEHYFIDQLTLTNDKLEAAERHRPSITVLNELQSLSDKLHGAYDDLTVIINDEIDHHSDRYVEFSRDNRTRSNQINTVDSKIHNFTYQYSQQKEQQTRCEQRKTVVESKIKATESQLESIQKPKDNVQLQNNIVQLKSVIHEILLTEMELRGLVNDIGDNAQLEQPCRQLQSRVTSVKTKAEKSLREGKNADTVLKEHRHSINVATDFLQQCQRRFESISTKSNNIPQLESEFQKVTDLISSIDKNKLLISNCTHIAMSELKPLSDHGVEIIKLEIEQINKTFDELEKSSLKSHNTIESMLDQMKQKNDAYESLLLWLRKMEKDLKAMAPIDSEESIEKDLQWLQSLTEQLLSKQGDIDLYSQYRTTPSKTNQLKDKFDFLMEFVKKTSENYGLILTSLRTFHSLLAEWSHWFQMTQPQRNTLSSMTDQNRCTTIKGILQDKGRKYDEMTNLVTKGELLIHRLSVASGNNVKITVKTIKDQWHEIFDDLTVMVDNLEEKIQNVASVRENLARMKTQLDRTRLLFNEEVHDLDPLRITFHIGTDEKGKQLRKLESILQTVVGMSYAVQKLETAVNTEDDSELEYETASFVKEFTTFSDSVTRAKELSSESYKCHLAFEDSFVQAKEAIDAIKNKLALCESANGTSMSLQSRMDRIQELINCDQQDEKIFTLLLTNRDRTENLVDDIERDMIAERVTLLLGERQSLQKQIFSTSANLEICFNDIDSFKSKYDTLSKDIGMVRHLLQNREDVDQKSLEVVTEQIKDLNQRCNSLEELALKILRNSNNELPIEMAKTLQKQILELSSNHSQAVNDVNTLNRIQDNFNRCEEELKAHINAFRMSFDDLCQRWNNSMKISDCESILKETNVLFAECLKADMLREDLEIILSKFQDFPMKLKKNTSRFGELSISCSHLAEELNVKRSSFENVIGEYKTVSEKLKNLQDDLKMYVMPCKEGFPETKLGKCNQISDLHSQVEHLNLLRMKVTDLNAKSVSNKNLSDFLTTEKIEMLKVIVKLLEEKTVNLKLLTGSLNDQEILENELSTIKESMYCVETSKITLTSQQKLSGEILEKKIAETDKNLGLISSIKRQIDQNLSLNRVGCHFEIEELKTQRKRVDALDQEFKCLKNQFNKEAKRVLQIEDDVNDVERFIQRIQEEMNYNSEYGSTLENKRALLEKGKDIKARIFEEDARIENIGQVISDIRCNNDGAIGMEKLFTKLEKQHNNLKGRISSIIDKHEQSIANCESFETSYRAVTQEIFEMKSRLQMKSDQFPDLDHIKINVEQLIRLGEKCSKSSSEEGGNVISRRLDEAKKNWKNVEQIHKQMKLAVERENHLYAKMENQKKQLKEWLLEIKERLNKIKPLAADDANGKKKKHTDCKGILNEIQEWKRDVNQYFETTKEEKNNDVEMEMLKDYRALLNDINGAILEAKLALTEHLEYDVLVAEFSKGLDATENQISEFSTQSNVNIEEIEKQILKCRALHMRNKDENPKLDAIKHSFKKLLSNTSNEGQGALSGVISQVEGRYASVTKELQTSLQELEINKTQLNGFESSLKTFEDWLKTMEEKFTSRSLLNSLSEKQKKLKTYQGYLLTICNEKEKLDELSMDLKTLPLNLSLNHCVRGVSGRYATLSNLAQNYVERLARWEGTHQRFSDIQNQFSEKSLNITGKVKKLKDSLDGGRNVEQLLMTVEDVEKDVAENEELKIELDATLQVVLQETNSAGHEEINKPYIKNVKVWMEALGSIKDVKATIGNRQGQETKVNQFTQNLTAWIDGVRDSVLLEFSPHIQVPVLKNNLSLSDSLLQEVNQKTLCLLETKKENNNVKEDGVKKRFKDVEQDLLGLQKDLKKKKSEYEKQLEYCHTYRNSLDSVAQWIEETNLKMKTLAVNYGPEAEIDNKLITVRDIKMALSSHGKYLMEATIDSGNVFMKNAREKTDKERILAEVETVEKDYLSLSERIERIEDALNAVSQQWKQYRKSIDELSRSVKKCQKKKQQLLSFKNNYGSDVSGGIEKLTELIKEINEEKLKLEIVLSQTHSLKEITHEPHVEVAVQDLIDQLNEQELDCKYELDRMYQLNNEKNFFDDQYRQANDWIQNMKTSIIEIDQLHDVPTFAEFQKHFSNFQLLESKIIAGDRIVDECFQTGHRLSSFCDSDKDIGDIMKRLQSSWHNLKEKFSELKGRLSKLLDIWSMLDHLYTLVDDWIVKVNKEVEELVANGFVSEDVKDRSIRRLKEFQSSADSIRPKLSKILELFHKADSYSAFTKQGDPLNLQKRFCDTNEMIKVFEKQLNYTQNNIDKFYQEVSELEKLILNTSLMTNNRYRITDTINSTEEIDNQLRFCQQLKQQVNCCEEDNMRSLTKLKDVIGKQLSNNSPLRIDIDSRITILFNGLKQTQLAIGKWKQALKQRSDKIMRYQEAMHKAETLLYTDLPNWWITKDITATMSPEDCENQIKECDSILENIAMVESEFQLVWLDYIHQRQLLTKSQSSDNFSRQNFETLPENHLDEIKDDFKEAKERVNCKLQYLRQHKEKWLQIENDIEDLESLFTNVYSEMERMITNQKDDDNLYSQFEDSALKIITTRDALERINDDINALNGNNDARNGYGVKYYRKYAKLCQDYSGLLQKIEVLRGNFRSFNVHNSMKEILKTDLPNDFPQMVFPQFGTQTTRNKANSIRTLKRYLSNPDLNDSLSRQSSGKPTDLRTSIDTGMTSKRIQTANDVGVQSRRSLSNNANNIMKDKMTFHNKDSVTNPTPTKQQRKEERFRRLGDLLSTIQLIKDDVSTMHSYDSSRRSTNNTKMPRQRSPLRSSVESVRHNYIPTTTNSKKQTTKKKKRSKSREFLGTRPSPTGCPSPQAVKGESPVKRVASPVKSSSRSSSIRQIVI